MNLKEKNFFSFKSGHLTKDSDISPDEIRGLYDLTDNIKKLHLEKKDKEILEGKTLGMIFEKSSTRTRVSFHVGMYQLGGQAINLSSDHIQLGRGESAEDTARVLSRYVDIMMIRTFSQETIDILAKHSSVPVINGLSDSYHPCQSLADFYTIRETMPSDKKNDKVSFCYIGDSANNMAGSLALVGSMLGHHLTFCSPKGYCLPEEILKEANGYCEDSGGSIVIEEEPEKGVKGANFLYTDVWVSMGKESEQNKRRKQFKRYAITEDLVNLSGGKPYVMHCLPANWGEEISVSLKNYENNIIFEQAENRLHVQKGILVALL